MPNYQINQEIKLNLKHLIAEIFGDLERQRQGKKLDGNKAIVLEALTSINLKGEVGKTIQSIAKVQEIDSILEGSYFPYQERGKNPLADRSRREDLLAFLNSVKQSYYNITDQGKSREFMRPKYDSEKDKLTYDEDTDRRLFNFILLPAVNAIENLHVEPSPQPEEPALSEQDSAKNPYHNLTDRLLVQGISGEFDQTLTLADISAVNEAIQAALKLDPNQKIADIIKQTLKGRGKNVFVTEEGDVIPFNPESFPGFTINADGLNTLSFSKINRGLNRRLGKKLQTDFVIASGGSITFSIVTKTIKTPGKETATPFDAAEVQFDISGGVGNNISFVIHDNEDNQDYLVTEHIPDIRGDQKIVHQVRRPNDSEMGDFDSLSPDLELPQKDLPRLESMSLGKMFEEAERLKDPELARDQARPSNQVGKISVEPKIDAVQPLDGNLGIPIPSPTSSRPGLERKKQGKSTTQKKPQQVKSREKFTLTLPGQTLKAKSPIKSLDKEQKEIPQPKVNAEKRRQFRLKQQAAKANLQAPTRQSPQVQAAQSSAEKRPGFIKWGLRVAAGTAAGSAVAGGGISLFAILT
ncbi:hypothetical protein GF376_04335 [Candidatus Peregrinibacteria bacterium]|nr:hypothetical protein [Candidatus Peregrinibacteria bacterium]